MRIAQPSKRSVSPVVLALLAPFAILAPTEPVYAQTGDAKSTPVIQQPALDALKRMSDKLAGAKSIGFEVRDMRDVPSSPGQLLTFVNSSEVEVERPDKLRVESETGFGETLLVYNAGKLSMLDRWENAYVTVDKSGSLDEVLRYLAESHGVQLAFEDFLLADPYAVLSKGLSSAYEVGPAVIDGDQTRHFAFAADKIEYQLWLDTTTDLPRMFAVTYLDSERPPHFLVEFDDWELGGKADSATFDFKAPQGATEIEFLPPATDK